MPYTDTHAHIYLPEFSADLDDVLGRADEAGVKKVCMPNIDHTSIDAMLEVEEKYPDRCRAMIGLHPCSVKKDFEKELYGVEQWLGKRPFMAIGEMGTDLYWDKTFWGQQQEAFVIQAKWAIQYRLPLVIHCRESIDETIELIRPLASERLTGIFHCFSGNAVQAKQIIDLGFYLGIGGVSTFRNGGLDKVLPDLSLDNIVLETDSPYLAPVPHRGKRNEPAYIPIIADRVAALLRVPLAEVELKTTLNAEKIFDFE